MRVKIMDKSGRASVTTFENGIGDALLTYENEALLRQKQGKDFPYVVPELLFDISYLGGWEQVATEIYGQDGIWSRITLEIANEK